MSQYAHMCRMDHVEIGHNDSERELCPLCRANNQIDALREELAAEKRRFAEHLDAWRANNEAHAKLIAELEPDAQRYRWLRDYMSVEDVNSFASMAQSSHTPDPDESAKTDTAIDAAMGNKDG